jgi:hypothetical protein
MFTDVSMKLFWLYSYVKNNNSGKVSYNKFDYREKKTRKRHVMSDLGCSGTKIFHQGCLKQACITLKLVPTFSNETVITFSVRNK